MEIHEERLRDATVIENISFYELTDDFCENMVWRAEKFGIKKLLVGASSLPIIRRFLEDEKICVATTLAYPSGAYVLESKLDELQCVDACGFHVQEFYIVPAFARYLDNRPEELRKEMETLTRAAKGRKTHFFVESSLLNFGQMEEICAIAADSGVSSIVATTGFAKYFDVAEPSQEQVRALVEAARGRVKIDFCRDKISREEAKGLLEAGVDQLLSADPLSYLGK